MAGSSRDDGDGMISDINVTPLVDITLVLLIIFMVTAKIIVSQSLPLDLPKAAARQEVQLIFGLELHATGETYVDGKKVANDDAILPLAREAQAKNADLRAVIRADTAVQHGRVIRALDLLKQAGVSKIAFGVSPVAPEPGGKVPGGAAPAPIPIRRFAVSVRRRVSASEPAAELALAGGSGASGPRRESEPDTLAAVIALGDRAARVGAILGVIVAILVHGAASAQAIVSLHDMYLAAKVMRDGIHDYFWTVYDVDLPKPEKPPEEKPPEPTPDPEPAPAPVPKAVAPPPKEDPYEPPPAPAQAAKVITAPEDPGKEKIEDLTDQGFVSGDGSGPGYGVVSAAGTASAATWNRDAKVGGVPGGKGTGPVAPPPPPPGPDMSRSATLAGGTAWNCPFPPEADAEQIDSAVAVLVITVRPDGTPLSVQVVSDPGHGFGRSARICALGKRYTPGLDKVGSPTTSTMPPVKVRFSR